MTIHATGYAEATGLFRKIVIVWAPALATAACTNTPATLRCAVASTMLLEVTRTFRHAGLNRAEA